MQWWYNLRFESSGYIPDSNLNIRNLGVTSYCDSFQWLRYIIPDVTIKNINNIKKLSPWFVTGFRTN